MTRRMLCVGLVVVCSSAVSSPVQLSAQTAARADGWVVLSVPDYQALRAKAVPPKPPPDPLPTDATITQIAYDLVASDDVATGRAEVTIDVLKDGWVSVPLPKGLNIREARLGSTPLAIVEGAPGTATRHVLLSRRGRSLVTLDIVAPVTSRAGVEHLVFPLASGGLVSAVVTLPRPDVDVTTTGGLIVERAIVPQGLRVVTHAAVGQTLSLTWHRKRDVTRNTLPLRLRAGVQHAIGLGEEIGQLTARVTADVTQGLASALVLKLPAGLVVNQVQGSHVADWEVQSGSLRVTLLEPVDRQVTMVVTGEFRPPATGRVEIPLLQVADAERETGGVAVEVLGAGEVTAHEARGLDPADPSDLAGLVSAPTSPAVVAFRYRGQQSATTRALALTISRYSNQTVLLATVDEARYRVLLTEDGKALVEAHLAVRNNQRSFLGVTLPAGATLWSSAIDGRPIRPGLGQQGGLLLPLQKRRAGEDAPAFAVHLVYVDRSTAWSAKGALQLTLPSIDVPISRTGVVVHHSPRFRVALEPGVFRAQPYEAPLSAVLQSAETFDPNVRAEERPSEDKIARAATAPGSGGGSASGTGSGMAPGAPQALGVIVGGAAPGDEQQQASRELRDLVDRFQREARGARAAGVLPVSIAFPEVGPMVYLAAELTPEGSAPRASFTFKRTVK